MVFAESTGGEYHIETGFAGNRRFGGLQAGGCRFDPGWMEQPGSTRTAQPSFRAGECCLMTPSRETLTLTRASLAHLTAATIREGGIARGRTALVATDNLAEVLLYRHAQFTFQVVRSSERRNRGIPDPMAGDAIAMRFTNPCGGRDAVVIIVGGFADDGLFSPSPTARKSISYFYQVS
jgi:hypothetical protein